MIHFKQVCKHYPGQKQPIVENVSFIVNSGEILVLLGSSGSGKTTLLKMVNRLIDASSGTIEIDGKNNTELNIIQLRRQIGYVSQDKALFPHLNVEDNISLMPKILKHLPKIRLQRAHVLLELVGLDPAIFANRFPNELSGGQQQRVAVARALALDPHYLLMDEPFGAVDPIIRNDLQQELLALNKVLHKTILFVTHDIHEALRLGDRIAILHQGQLQQAGTPTECLHQPSNAFVKSFIDTALSSASEALRGSHD